MKNILPNELSSNSIGLRQRQALLNKFQVKLKNLVSFVKYSYLVLVMVLLLCAVVELKHIFHIDIFPGIDTPIDNAYFAGADQLGIHTL